MSLFSECCPPLPFCWWDTRAHIWTTEKEPSPIFANNNALGITDVLDKGLRACLRCSLIKTFSQVSSFDWIVRLLFLHVAHVDQMYPHIFTCIHIYSQAHTSSYDTIRLHLSLSVCGDRVRELRFPVYGEQQWEGARGTYVTRCFRLLSRSHVDIDWSRGINERCSYQSR